jgi:4-hydroxybenzoate polyprenyltransferase|tara:strand:- start:28515 stop:28811 length:297 start_codon:yes stop_codon:yes gene_type:complete
MNKEQPARKSLRQRVADRKRGIKEVRPVSERKKRAIKILSLMLVTVQYLGLLLLLLSLGGIVTDNYEMKNGNLIILYCAMFLVGRFGIMVIKSVGMFK